LEIYKTYFVIGLQNYCRFGAWTKEENMQLKKNWKNATKVAHLRSLLD